MFKINYQFIKLLVMGVSLGMIAMRVDSAYLMFPVAFGLVTTSHDYARSIE